MHGLPVSKCGRKIILSDDQKTRKVEVVKGWLNSKIDMDKVIFSDECKFTLDGNEAPKTWVKKITHRKRKRPFRGGSFMVWGCMSRSGILPRKIEGTLTTVKYCALLEDDILPILNAQFENFWLQQDNARPHTSKSAKVFLC